MKKFDLELVNSFSSESGHFQPTTVLHAEAQASRRRLDHAPIHARLSPSRGTSRIYASRSVSFSFYILLKFIAPRSAIGLIISKLFPASSSPYPLSFVRPLCICYLSFSAFLPCVLWLLELMCVVKIGEKMRLEAEREGRRGEEANTLWLECREWLQESAHNRHSWYADYRLIALFPTRLTTVFDFSIRLIIILQAVDKNQQITS